MQETIYLSMETCLRGFHDYLRAQLIDKQLKDSEVRVTMSMLSLPSTITPIAYILPALLSIGD